MTIEEYEKEALEDLNFDITQFKECSKYLPLKKIKWSRYLFNEECISNQIEDKLRELYRDKFKYYTYEYSEKIEKKNIDIYIKGDKEYQTANQAFGKQKSKEKYVQSVISCIDTLAFQTNNILKHIIWESGANA